MSEHARNNKYFSDKLIDTQTGNSYLTEYMYLATHACTYTILNVTLTYMKATPFSLITGPIIG